MCADVFYLAGDLGATVRGAAILKALGYGKLVTQYKGVAQREGVEWFGSPAVRGDVYIWDTDNFLKRPGLQVSIGVERDVDLNISLDMPIAPRHPSEIDLSAAESWWKHSVQRIDSPGHVREYAIDPGVRTIMCGGRGGHDLVDDPSVRVVGPGYGFYWPAMELMPLAETVIGGEQTAGELAILRGDADPDGAQLAAAAIQRLIERNR